MSLQLVPRLHRAAQVSAGCVATLFSVYLLLSATPRGVLGVAVVAVVHSLPFFVGALLAPVARRPTSGVTPFLVGIAAGLAVIVCGTVLTEWFLLTQVPAASTLAVLAPLGVAAITGFAAAAWLTSGRLWKA